MPNSDSGRQSPRLQNKPNGTSSGNILSDAELKQLVLDIKKQNDRILTNQDEFLRKIEQNTNDINDLKVENAELKNKICVLDEKLIRLDQYSRKDVVIMTGLAFSPGENKYELENDIIQIISSITGKQFNTNDFSAIHRNGIKVKENGRPPSITLKFIRFQDKDMLFDKNVIKKRQTMYRDIKFHHCLSEGMIAIQNSIKDHEAVKFVNYLGSSRHFSVCIKKFGNADSDIFINRIQSYDHFIVELNKVMSNSE